MGRSENPLYTVWLAIRSRCEKPHHGDYPLYGALGIRVCRRWRDPRTGFRRFLLDVGPRPPGCVLARINTRHGYSPNNVRWATRAEQNRNGRGRKLTADAANEILGRLEHGERPYLVARRFGVTGAMVHAIRAGRAWRELAPFAGAPSVRC